MKRWMSAIFAVVFLCGGAAQAAKKKEAAPEAVQNPLRASTSEGIFSSVGARMQPPEAAALVSWWLIHGEAPMAEMFFVLEGVEFSYRAQAAEGVTDISGMNYVFVPQETVQISGHEGLVESYSDETQSVGVVLWYDAEASLAYSLAMRSDASADILLNLAETLFGQQQ